MLSTKTRSCISRFFKNKWTKRCFCCWCCPCILVVRAWRCFLGFVYRYLPPGLILILAAIFFFWGEIFVYWQASRNWSTTTEQHNKRYEGEETVQILLVGDPQLVGDQNEARFIGFLTRWDADRFLRKTYSYAYDTSKPDIVLFVGDLLDEGGFASNESLARYANRFESIFKTRYKRKYEGAKTEYVAYWGDNDVQLGDQDVLSPEMMNYYHKRVSLIGMVLGFDLVDVAACREFFGGSILMRHFDPLLNDPKNVHKQGCEDAARFQPDSSLFKDIHTNQAKRNHSKSSLLRMVVSHFPLIGPSAMDMDAPTAVVLRTFAPSLVISAHWHHSAMFLCTNCLAAREGIFLPFFSAQYVQEGTEPVFAQLPTMFKNDAPQVHILAPTASYRMGTRFTGYGLVTLNLRENSLIYSVFWNPHRYSVLLSYLAIVSLVLLRFLAVAAEKPEVILSFITFVKKSGCENSNAKIKQNIP